MNNKTNEIERKNSNPITLPREVDLSKYDSLPLFFTDREGRVLILFRSTRQSEDSVEVIVNVISPMGDVVAGFTFFDLKV